MNSINNVEELKKLMTFDSPDFFYHLQIIKRKKEHPELGSNAYIVKTYYISSFEQLDFYIDEIICLCNFHNARACLNLNKRSYEATCFHTLKKITDQIMNKDYKNARKAYNSVCGSISAAKKDKRWIIDVDDLCMGQITKVLDIIPKECYIATVKTKNGYHVISSPFNIQEYAEKVGWDIHKNNPTILYMPV